MATFVICHGAWAAGWSWQRIRPRLHAMGHEVYTPTYTGLGERAAELSPRVDLSTHITDILAVLHYENLRDVVLVGHSYGGMVATGVADLARDRLASLIYLDAFVPNHGQCLLDLLPPDSRADRLREIRDHGDGWLLPPIQLPADMPLADVTWMRERRRFQPARTFTQPLMLINHYTNLPRTYIYCTRRSPGDHFGPFAVRAKSEPVWRYLEIDSSHSPHVTAPDMLVASFRHAIS